MSSQYLKSKIKWGKLFLGMGFIFIFFFVLSQQAEAVKIYWTSQTVDETGIVGLANSIALDSSDKIHISYWDQTNAKTKYATNSSGSWSTEVAYNAAPAYTTLALDNSNKAHIGFYASNSLLYTTNSSGSWSAQSIEITPSIGTYPSLALDSSNKAHISYSDDSNFDLKYATNASGPWVTQTLDSTGSVGIYTSLALDSSNKAHISYYDYTNYDLKYATNASGSWVYQTLDSTGNVGAFTSLALDSSNKVHISYSDGSNADLKYATNSSGSWVYQTVDNSGSVGEQTFIALDSSNKAHITYLDAGNFTTNLKYATNSSGSWATETLTEAGLVATNYNSPLDLDSSNNVHISYFYSPGSDLNYIYSEPGNTHDDTGGTNFLVDLGNGFQVTYDQVTSDGRTTIGTASASVNDFLSDTLVEAMLSDSLRDISIEDATFTGNFTLAFPYSQATFDAELAPLGYSELELKLYHRIFSGGNWVIEDITTSVDTTNNILYGQTNSFSDFGAGVSTPEPITLLLLGSALFGLLPLRKRFFK